MLLLTAENFKQEVLLSENPVMVEFYSTKCGKCAMMEDVVESLSIALEGKVKVGKVEIAKSVELKKQYQIKVTPTFIVFNKGKALGCMLGVLDEGLMEERVMDLLRGINSSSGV